jgi:hypothetical protein
VAQRSGLPIGLDADAPYRQVLEKVENRMSGLVAGYFLRG